MSKVAWPKLMRLGLVELGLPPDTFWSLTPAELMMMVGVGDSPLTITRSSFEELAAQFPDRQVSRNDVE